MREDENAGRRASRRKRKRRKLSRLAYILILIVVALCAAVVCAAVFFKVDTITVSGTSVYSNAQIISASGIKKGTSLFAINKKDVENRISSSLPYIAKVNISFKLPTGVKLEVTKGIPQYVIKCNNKFAYLNGNLKVLETNSAANKYKAAILINGASIDTLKLGYSTLFKNKSQATIIKTLAEDVKEAGILKITAMNIADKYQLSVVYDNRITIVIGTLNAADEKLTDAADIIKNEMQPSDKGSLDVSDQNKRHTFSPTY